MRPDSFNAIFDFQALQVKAQTKHLWLAWQFYQGTVTPRQSHDTTRFPEML
jgi:hypothetical protein